MISFVVLIILLSMGMGMALGIFCEERKWKANADRIQTVNGYLKVLDTRSLDVDTLWWAQEILKKHYSKVFYIDKNQQVKLNAWMDKLPKPNDPNMSGRISYEFTKTSLGDIIVATDIVSGKKIDITDFTKW